MRARLEARARLTDHCRRFFAERSVLEVDTPILSQAAVTDVHLASLATDVGGGLGRYWLQTSPEYPMKRLLAAGVGDCFQICKVFRDAESGRHHNPEFTMLEWYRLGFDQHALMDEVAALLVPALAKTCPGRPERLSYRDCFQQVLDIDPFTIAHTELVERVAEHVGAPWPDADRDTLLDALMGLVIGPRLGHGALTFIHDYPASQAALARVLPGEPAVAARFEAYAAGIELCNGFHELTDAEEQRRRFEADLVGRRARGLPSVPIDERFLAALGQGLPDCAGVAVGLDRVLMVAGGHQHLNDILAYPIAQA